MKNKLNSTLFAVACMASSAILFTACNNNDGDTTRPVIVLNAPTEETDLDPGDRINLDMDLSDNEKLFSYKIEIHSNFDDHDHTHSRAGETIDFTFEHTWNVAQEKSVHVEHDEIEIPENATPGEYHLIVHCLDAANNEHHIAGDIVIGDHDHHDH